MQWLSNFSLVLRSNVSTLCEKFEDPERMLHQLLIDMEHELERVRNTVAGAIADEIQLGNSVKRAQGETEKWDERAAAALARDNESAAHAALEQKVVVEERLEGLRREHAKQHEQTEKLRGSVLDLEEKIRQARQKQTLLLARLARADSTQKINRAFDRVSTRSAFTQFNRLEQKAERAEAMSDAYDRLDGIDPEQVEMEREFAAAERKEKVDSDLAKLKSRLKESEVG